MATLRTDDAMCPIPENMLARLYRCGPAEAVGLVRDLPDSRRAELAVFCYGRAHLRALAMELATTCDAQWLVRTAGNAGQALAVQCRQSKPSNARISLAGTRH